MIAEIIATYHGTKDLVQAVALIREDDGTSLHQQLKYAHVAVQHNKTAILTKQITVNDYNDGEGQFIVFFLHPPIQRDMYVELSVELQDGRTALQRVQVSTKDLLSNINVATNPMIPGLPIKDHTNAWDSEGRERKPD